MKTALIRTILAMVAATTMATVIASPSASAAPAAPASATPATGPAASVADAPAVPPQWTPLASFATRADCEAARSRVPYPSLCVGVITGGFVLWADV